MFLTLNPQQPIRSRTRSSLAGRLELQNKKQNQTTQKPEYGKMCCVQLSAGSSFSTVDGLPSSFLQQL